MKLLVKTPTKKISKTFKIDQNAELQALQYLIANYERGVQPIEVTLDGQRQLLTVNHNWRGLFSDGEKGKYTMTQG